MYAATEEEGTALAEWLNEGIRRGWCSPPFCATHDGAPQTKDEAEQDDADGYVDDLCVHSVRLLEPNDELASHPRWGDDPLSAQI